MGSKTFPTLSPYDETAKLPAAFNALSKHVEELTVKAEDLGGFESLARLSKAEVEIAELSKTLDGHRNNLEYVDAKVRELEAQVGERAEVTLLRRLWRLGLIWLGMQLLYSVARIVLALKGARL